MGSKTYETDFMDINWVINHVKNLPQRIDVFKKLGYKIGYNVFTSKNNNFIKSVIIGKKGELRIQVSEKLDGLPLTYCVILDSND